MSNPNNYHVGWICALSTELVAATCFLDEEHDALKYNLGNDNNSYTLGRVGKHNVVIAALPDGEYGVSSAASVARDMLHSFPNIRIGLLVGIGGGAPNAAYDIRLGDVVVSAADNRESSVFQYDFGEAIQGQGFQTKGMLDKPPRLLSAAVNGLKAQYELNGNGIEETIIRILRNKPRLQKKYGCPDPSSDMLFKSNVVHPNRKDAACATDCNNDPSKLVERQERAKYDDNPAIHYGIVASASQRMRNAKIRDKLAEQKGVLCFETEAAGLMDHFPCLVIRGISDYSDSHANDDWQGYAAMAAAAYAKGLLSRIPLNQIESQKVIASTKRSGKLVFWNYWYYINIV